MAQVMLVWRQSFHKVWDLEEGIVWVASIDKANRVTLQEQLVAPSLQKVKVEEIGFL